MSITYHDDCGETSEPSCDVLDAAANNVPSVAGTAARISTAAYRRHDDRQLGFSSPMTSDASRDERDRLIAAGLEPGAIERADTFFIMRMRDPDNNLVVLSSAER